MDPVIRRVLAVLAAVLVAAPVAAQDWNEPWADPMDRPGRVDISVSAGFLLPTDWSDMVLLGTISPAFGVLEQVLVQDVRLRADTKYAGSATYWRGRYGFRTEVGYSRSSLSIGGEDLGLAGQPVNVRTWLYGVRGAIGLVEYTPGRVVWPYVFLGAGGLTYDLSQRVSLPLLTFIEHGRPGEDWQPDLRVVNGGREFVLQVNELDVETALALSYGVGVDFRLPMGPAGLGVRLEVSDHVAPSPLRLRIHELGGFAQETRLGHRRVHHLRAVAGLVVTLGR